MNELVVIGLLVLLTLGILLIGGCIVVLIIALDLCKSCRYPDIKWEKMKR